MTEKKNINYEASAVNLVNPPPVIADLRTLRDCQANIALIKEKIAACIPQELTDTLNQAEKALALMAENIKIDIVAYGSYQNLETGEYALRQRRESITYKPEFVRQFAPAQVAYAVIVEAVDSKVMETLIKSGKIEPETAKQCGIVEEKFAFIIR